MRDAAQQERSPLFIAIPDAMRLDDVATRTFRAAPGDLARLGSAMAHELDAVAASVPGLRDDVGVLARDIARAPRQAKRPLAAAGTGCASPAVVQAAAKVAWALGRGGHAAQLCLAVPECNSLGLGRMSGGRLADAFAMRLGERLILPLHEIVGSEESNAPEFVAKAAAIWFKIRAGKSLGFFDSVAPIPRQGDAPMQTDRAGAEPTYGHRGQRQAPAPLTR